MLPLLNIGLEYKIKILVVGGGVSGFISALILKNFLNVQVDLVYSDNIGTIGVGEGSTEHFRTFMDFCGISNEEIVCQTDATYKVGLIYDNWTEKPYMHNVSKILAEDRINRFSHVYSKLLSEGSDHLTTSFFWRNKISSWFSEKVYPNPPVNQYHFNSLKLIEFLKNKSISTGIGVFEDTVSEVSVDQSGNIEYVQGIKKKYYYDFFIDCTGFKRILISKLGAKWISHSKYLKTNSAIVFQTPDTEDYNLWSYSRAMEYGWMFRLPTWGRHGNGYIYSNEYITSDQAKKEIEDYLGYEINVGKELSFDPGALDVAWINNCVAIGLSSNFVEPLEASSIGTTIQQSFLLANRIINYDQSVIKKYNWSFNSIITNIRDFIVLHYIVKKENTKFWKDLKNLELPETLKDRLDLWKYKLPIPEDFAHESNYVLFRDSNFISVLGGLKFYSQEFLKKEFDSLALDIQKDAELLIKERDDIDNSTGLIGHKELLLKIRNDYLEK